MKNDHEPHEDSMRGRVSIDTSLLYIPGDACRISDKPALEVIRAGKSKWKLMDKFLWHDATGKAVKGAMATCIGEDCLISLRPDRDFGGGGKPPCFIVLSAPKVLRGNDLDPIDGSMLDGVLSGVEETLRSIGIETNIMAAQVSRFDLFRIMRMKRAVRDYIPVARSLPVPITATLWTS